jgi:hypothetical protein
MRDGNRFEIGLLIHVTCRCYELACISASIYIIYIYSSELLITRESPASTVSFGSAVPDSDGYKKTFRSSGTRF